MELEKLDMTVERDVLNVYRPKGMDGIAIIRHRSELDSMMMLPGTILRTANELGNSGFQGLIMDYNQVNPNERHIAYDYEILAEPGRFRSIAFTGVKGGPEEVEALTFASLDSAVEYVSNNM